MYPIRSLYDGPRKEPPRVAGVAIPQTGLPHINTIHSMEHGKVTTFCVNKLQPSTSSDESLDSDEQIHVDVNGMKYIYDPSYRHLYRGTQIKTSKQPAILRRVLSKKQLINSLVQTFSSNSNQTAADTLTSTTSVASGSQSPSKMEVPPVTLKQLLSSTSQSVSSLENKHTPSTTSMSNLSYHPVSLNRVVPVPSSTKPILSKPITSNTQTILNKTPLDNLTDLTDSVSEKFKEFDKRANAESQAISLSGVSELSTATSEERLGTSKREKMQSDRIKPPVVTIPDDPVVIPHPHTRVVPLARPIVPTHPHLGGHLGVQPRHHLRTTPPHVGSHLGAHYHTVNRLPLKPYAGTHTAVLPQTVSHIGPRPHLGVTALSSTRVSPSVASLKHSSVINENLISSSNSQFSTSKFCETNLSASTIEMQRKILNPDNPSSDNPRNIYIRKLRNHSRTNTATPFEKASRFFADIQDNLSVPTTSMNLGYKKTVKGALGSQQQNPKIKWENVMNFFTRTNVDLLYSVRNTRLKVPSANVRHELIFENGSAGNIIDSDGRFYYVLCNSAASLRVMIIPKDEVDLDERLKEQNTRRASSPTSDDDDIVAKKQTLTSHHKNTVEIEREKAKKRQIEENKNRSHADKDKQVSNKDSSSTSKVIQIKTEVEPQVDSGSLSNPITTNRTVSDISEQDQLDVSSSKKKPKRNKRLEQVISQLVAPKSNGSRPNSPASSNSSRSPASSGTVSPNNFSKLDEFINNHLEEERNTIHIKTEPIDEDTPLNDINQSETRSLENNNNNNKNKRSISAVSSIVKQEELEVFVVESKKVKLGFS